MTTQFQKDIRNPEKFIITMELVPKAESSGRSIDAVLELAEGARKDGRLSAVTITDNPGGNPSLSPDVLGSEILHNNMDVIIHFTCRDMNRAGMESRALQLMRMGMTNILALTGDYSGKGFGGQSAPVFDLDSTHLLSLFSALNEKSIKKGNSSLIFPGCAVSPFKWTEAEAYAQYFKLCKKTSSGAKFMITQLGYDARKFEELIRIQKLFQINIPVIASIYMLTPRSAKVMNSGKVPGAVVHSDLLDIIKKEWAENKRNGYFAAIERAAKLAAIVKGLGYRGIHIGGVHRNFITVKRMIDRLGEIEDQWRSFLPEFDYPMDDQDYLFEKDPSTGLSMDQTVPQQTSGPGVCHQFHFRLMHGLHQLFFSRASFLADFNKNLCQWIDKSRPATFGLKCMEDAFKKLLLSCQSCGDCGIQHAGFLCPESKCPKHTRNGPCGGSRNGRCEVYPDKNCLWFMAYLRLSILGSTGEMAGEWVPPRMWELNKTSSWMNFHLKRDHQGASFNLQNRMDGS
ncbi:MAG: methylenetetrahydrofolate reductase [Desulfobacteraceae bacterium]|nr:methylenetetrahydrofolate reductase [Desulfobacteraceae bacterium]MBU4000899.1 methylenetetrahydrofolate reductase C-terminal domain-containing protein [Pseudomonadota bacterium]